MRDATKRCGVIGTAILAALATAACNGGGGGTVDPNIKPSFVGVTTKKSYDGSSDDLLTAGLGKSGLQ